MTEKKRRPRGQVTPLGGGDYFIRVQTNERGPRGRFKALSETLRDTTPAKARRRVRDLLAQIDTGQLHRPAPKTFLEVRDEFMEQMMREGKRPASLYTYADASKAYLLPYLGHLRLEAVTPIVVRDLYNTLQDRALSTGTIRYARTVLNLILKAAVVWGYLKENPAAAVKPPQGADGRVAYSMTPDEARSFVDAALLDPDDLVFAFALLTGLRPEEYLGLPRRHVELDGERGLVRVRQVAVKLRGGGWKFPPPKTKRGIRDVPFPAWLYHELKRREKLVDSRRLATGEGWADHGLVFPSRVGTPQSEDSARGRFRRLLKRAGLPAHFTLYSLRYTFATLQFLAGERDRVISDLMGHKRTDFTKEVYTKVLPVMREQASDSLERLLFGTVRATFAQSMTTHVM